MNTTILVRQKLIWKRGKCFVVTGQSRPIKTLTDLGYGFGLIGNAVGIPFRDCSFRGSMPGEDLSLISLQSHPQYFKTQRHDTSLEKIPRKMGKIKKV